MTQIIENYTAFNASFAGHRYQIEKVIREQTGVLNPTYTQGAAHTYSTTTNSAFNGGCLTASGLCVFAPWFAPFAGIYDYVTNTFLESAPHGLAVRAFCGANLIDEKYVAMIPYSSAYVYFLDMTTGVFERGPAHLKSALDAFTGGAITEDADGRRILVMCPTGSTRIGIVRLDTREYVDGPELTGRRGSQLLPNGHVAMLGLSGGVVVYDPIKNVTYTPNSTAIGSNGAVVLPDGRMTVDATNRAAFLTLTPNGKTDSWPAVGSVGFSPNTFNKFKGIKLAPNGDLIAMPGEKEAITIYAPPSPKNYKGIISTGPTLPAAPGAAKFAGGIMVPNGDIILIPDRSQYVGIYRHMDNAKGFPIEVCASRYYGSAF